MVFVIICIYENYIDNDEERQCIYIITVTTNILIL